MTFKPGQLVEHIPSGCRALFEGFFDGDHVCVGVTTDAGSWQWRWKDTDVRAVEPEAQEPLTSVTGLDGREILAGDTVQNVTDSGYNACHGIPIGARFVVARTDDDYIEFVDADGDERMRLASHYVKVS